MDLRGRLSNPPEDVERLEPQGSTDLREDTGGCRGGPESTPKGDSGGAPKASGRLSNPVQRRLDKGAVEELAERYLAGATVADLAGLYGVHRTTVTGHLERAGVPRRTVDLTLPPGDDPLVVVAFSTTPMGQADVLQRVADGLADLPVRTLITLGPAVGIDKLDLPRNAVAVPFAPHDQVLPEAALMVSHVGHGSMCAAARHGVPILAMPMGRDQDRNAEILSAHGIGTSLQPTADAREIAESARSLLADGTVRQRAAEMAQQVKATPGLEQAVRLLT